VATRGAEEGPSPEGAGPPARPGGGATCRWSRGPPVTNFRTAIFDAVVDAAAAGVDITLPDSTVKLVVGTTGELSDGGLDDGFGEAGRWSGDGA